MGDMHWIQQDCIINHARISDLPLRYKDNTLNTQLKPQGQMLKLF